MKIGYFVHDLGDAAVERRVRLFIWGGALPVLLGFYRAAEPPQDVSGVEPMPLGRTEPGRFIDRLKSVFLWSLKSKSLLERLKDCDAIVARNLEMLILAWYLRRQLPKAVPLIYECLDIHTKMLGKGPVSIALRALERFLLKDVHTVIVSSPAFRDHYFKDRQDYTGRVDLIENKVMADNDEPRKTSPSLPAPPWVIGWFGVIRCRKSFAMLKSLVARIPNIQVLIAGKPAYDQIPDFDAEVAATPAITFAGPYKLSDLPKLYGQVHFTWAIDYFEEGLNSSWLLPNRLYEGGICGSLPIALGDVETGRWLQARGAGLIISNPETDLPPFFENLTPDTYEALRDQTLAIPSADLVLTPEDADRIVARLAA